MDNKLSWVDSLKGIAMCGVVMVHCGSNGLTSSFSKIISFGQCGVQMFFLLSGFLAFSSVERYFEKNNYCVRNILKWIALKICNLVPLFYLSISVCAIVQGGNIWLGDELGITFGNVVAHLICLHGMVPQYCNSIIGVEWYLGVLVIFYLLIPLLYKIIHSIERALVVFCLVCISCMLLKYGMYNIILNGENIHFVVQNYIENFGIHAQLPVLILGIILHYIVRNGYFTNVKNSKWISIVLVVFVAILLLEMVYYTSPFKILNQITLIGILFFVLVISQHLHSFFLIDNVIFRFIGKISYAIYLFHYLLIWLYNKYMPFSIGNSFGAYFVKWGTIMFGSIVLSLILERYYNKKITVALKNWIIQWK